MYVSSCTMNICIVLFNRVTMHEGPRGCSCTCSCSAIDMLCSLCHPTLLDRFRPRMTGVPQMEAGRIGPFRHVRHRRPTGACVMNKTIR